MKTIDIPLLEMIAKGAIRKDCVEMHRVCKIAAKNLKVKNIKECPYYHRLRPLRKYIDLDADTNCSTDQYKEANEIIVSSVHQYFLDNWKTFCAECKDNIVFVMNPPIDDSEERRYFYETNEHYDFGDDCSFVFISGISTSPRYVLFLCTIKDGICKVVICDEEGGVVYTGSSEEKGDAFFKHLFNKDKDKDKRLIDDRESFEDNHKGVLTFFYQYVSIYRTAKTYGQPWRNGMGLTLKNATSPIVNKTGINLTYFNYE